MQAIGILGGTFDPVHIGHLRMALEMYQKLPLAEVRLMPCAQPVHKEKVYASAKHRVAMLTLATADEPGLVIDDCEIKVDAPSYMINSVKTLRQELPQQPLCLILGSDAFALLPSWHLWQELVDLVHIVVVHRPSNKNIEHDVLEHWLSHRQIDQPSQLLEQPAGFIITMPMEPLAITATHIRQTIANGQSPRYWLTDKVWDYIRDNKLYGYQAT